ncbi:phage tail-like protein [Streptomyces glaucescens]|jgi:phage tail-like protein|uniref:phage tail protein n=1 Tax=unclassified Streptomyces TaxID=2593676 RepID=UPI00093C38AE|nr:phage tail protein [Streptomyces sp. TSRI0107]OKJ77375.1 phage tail protein [Streptomyces sp. TSRI0107]
MPEVTRRDPFKNFRFKVKFSGETAYIAGISKVSGLKRTTEVIRHRDGGDPGTSRKLPGRTEYEAITLERGCTVDTAFEEWANRIWSLRNSAGGLETSLKDFRRDLIIDVFDEAGKQVLSYSVREAWVSEYQGLPELDAGSAGVAFERITVEHHGWVREKTSPPEDSQFTDIAG